MAHPNADRDTLEAALIGHEAQLGTIEAKIAEIRRQLRGRAPTEAAGIKPEIPPREKNHERGSSQTYRGSAEEALGGMPEIQRQVS